MCDFVTKYNASYSIVLFDGGCNFCNFWVKFISRRDSSSVFYFASLQSEVAKKIISSYHLDTIDSIVMVEGGKFYTKSTAVLHIFKKLDNMWKLFYLFIFIPKPLRDFAYSWIARHRYLLFGKRKSCMVPSEQIKERFLE